MKVPPDEEHPVQLGLAAEESGDNLIGVRATAVKTETEHKKPPQKAA